MRMNVGIAMLAAVAFAAAAPVVSADGEKKTNAKGHAKHDAEDDETAASREAKFRSWDKDGNGSLSRGEYPGHPGNFRALDSDNDGALTFEEFKHRAGGGAPSGETAMTEEFAAKDHDRNGTLTRAEWPDAFEFDRRDHNRDGVLTRDEYFSPRDPGGPRRGVPPARHRQRRRGRARRMARPPVGLRRPRYQPQRRGQPRRVRPRLRPGDIECGAFRSFRILDTHSSEQCIDTSPVIERGRILPERLIITVRSIQIRALVWSRSGPPSPGRTS